MNKAKMKRVYKAYRKLRTLWLKQPDTNPEKAVMIECLNESMTEIVEKYMTEVETELYEVA